MKYVIDMLVNPNTGFVSIQTFDTAGPDGNGFQSPLDPTKQVTYQQYLQWLNGDVARRQQAGWMTIVQIPGAGPTTTRWDVLVKQLTAPNSGVDVSALDLD